mmetsp:Transcript_11391/g.25520  ORF Transcript_11391/g.25520 Transcript_11391/m.25520 type:complete len:542 (+) Transcript_11391:215-1840(+)
MTIKASLKGPNRRRRGRSAASALTFLIKPIEDLSAEDSDTPDATQRALSALGNACLFTTRGKSGKELLKWHNDIVEGSADVSNDSLLIHFHDIPVYILRAVPLSSKSDTTTNNNNQTDQDIIYLSKVHCHNHKVCTDSKMQVTCCSRPNDGGDDYPSLSAIGIEVHVRKTQDESPAATENEDMEFDRPTFCAKDICRELMNHTANSVLSVNETVLIKSEGTELVCRVAEVRVATEDTAAASVSMSAVTMDEPYRGRVSIHTDFYVSASDINAITIEGCRRLPDGQQPEDVVHVTTNDGEWFPVRRGMLAPCIKLTKYVQAGRGKYKDIPSLSDDECSEDAPTDDGCPHCAVQIDCCTFDRVLVFIASLLFPDEQTFVLDPSEVNAMADAAEALGLMSLADLCTSQTSSFESRVRKDEHIRLAEVMKRNDENDELLIILDGMVLDITRWIDEHPGGPSIIPTQALNIDCTVFFEMYHVSRQSFLYLKSFYIGELAPEDLTKLRNGAENIEASEGFLQSLRSYTTEWRVQIRETQGDKVHKSL